MGVDLERHMAERLGPFVHVRCDRHPRVEGMRRCRERHPDASLAAELDLAPSSVTELGRERRVIGVGCRARTARTVDCDRSSWRQRGQQSIECVRVGVHHLSHDNDEISVQSDYMETVGAHIDADSGAGSHGGSLPDTRTQSCR